MAAPTLLGLLFVVSSRTEAGSQFVVIEEAKTWSDANDYCGNTYGTTLATIRNQFDSDDLNAVRDSLNLDHTTVNIWIGMNRRLDSAGSWQWASGFACAGDCADNELWAADLPYSKGQYRVEDCAVQGTTGLIYDNHCDSLSVRMFACDVPVMGPRMVTVETGLITVNSEVASLQNQVQVLERIISGFDAVIDAEQSVSAPVGLGVYGDYALCALALLNLVMLLGLFAFCMVRRVPMDMAKVQYGRVYDTEMETDKL